MRLTRGCRAGGGVACSSLEYGGIRAATNRTPAPRGLLFLSLSRLSHLPTISLIRPFSLIPPTCPLSLLFPQEHWYSPAIPSYPYS